MIGRLRTVRYAPELDELPVGTILAFTGSTFTAKRDRQGWLIYGRSSTGGPQRDTTGSVERNLPARVVRKGARR